MRAILITLLLGSRAFAEPAPNPTIDRSETEQRVDSWLRDGQSRSDVAKGRVDPAYRALERRLQADVLIPKEIIQPHGWMGGIVAQTRAFFGHELRSKPPSPTDRAIEPRDAPLGVPEGSGLHALPLEQAMAAQQQFFAPQWIETEVAVDVRPDGSITSVAIAKSSGSAPFDRTAQSEVQRIAARRRYAVPRAARLIFAVRGAYTATLPATAIAFDESGTLPGRGIDRFVQAVDPVEHVDKEVALRAVLTR